MEIRILGPLEVIGVDGSISVPAGRARALLALLALHASEVMSTDRLIDKLWAQNPPPTARTKLQGLVSTLRRRLEPSQAEPNKLRLLQTTSPGYVLALGPDQVDALRFRRLIAEASAAPPAQKADLLRQALRLWRGPVLADFTYEPFAQAEITSLEELRAAATEQRVDADLELGHHAEVIAELEALAEEHPFRERFRYQLMLSLYRCGRQAEALGVYRETRMLLTEELGIEPGPELAQLEEAILRQDQWLHPSVSPPVFTLPVVTAEPWLSEIRKTVTVVFIELAAVGDVDPEPEIVRRIIGAGYQRAKEVLSRHGGTVEGFIGDVVVAVFGVPSSREDDALRAVRAAVDVRRVLGQRNADDPMNEAVRLATRIGIHTGEVVTGDAEGQSTSGNTVTLTARLQQSAVPGQILVSDSTRHLAGDALMAEPAGELSVHGGSGVKVWRLVNLIDKPRSSLHRTDGRMVGRDEELDLLGGVFEQVMDAGAARLVTVIGDAGIGKSRLVREFGERIAARANVFSGSCPSYGDGVTFLPMREVISQAAGEPSLEAIESLFGNDRDAIAAAAPIASALGIIHGAEDPAKIFPAFRQLFESLTQSGPVVVVVDDLHWAEPTLIDLMSYLSSSVKAPLLLVGSARPEILDQVWSERVPFITLGPLDSEESRSLVHDIMQPHVATAEATDKVVELAGGNPLFIEQIVATLRDDADEVIPPTLQALLAARLDRLGPGERDLLRRASVIGREFPSQALTYLVPADARPFVDHYLQALEERGLIQPTVASTMPETTSSFRHVLIQQAAYRSMTLEARAELHERMADWLEQGANRYRPDLDEIVGYHLEQACRQRHRLGLGDSHTHHLGERSGERLTNAGMRAYDRFDISAAANLLSRAQELISANDPRRPEVLSRLAEIYPMLGRHSEADAVLTEMLESTDDEHVRSRLRLARARGSLITGPDPTPLVAIEKEAGRALELFAGTGDDAGASLATYVLGLIYLRRGEIEAMEEIAWRGLAHAERSGELREEAAARWWMALALVNGSRTVDDCIAVCNDLLRWRDGIHVGVGAELARLHAMRGEFDRARMFIAQARDILVERIRARRPLMFVTAWGALIEVMAGQTNAAEQGLREALRMATELGEVAIASPLAANLSCLLPASSEEAEQFAMLSASSAPREDVESQARWRLARARLLTARGEHAEAMRVAQEAVELIPLIMLNLAAEARVGLARAASSGGQPGAGSTAFNQAIELYQRRGNIAAASAVAAAVG